MAVEIAFETGQADAASEVSGFRKPQEFSHTGTEIAQDFAGAISGGTAVGNSGGAQEVVIVESQPDSYHMRTYGYFGVQVEGVSRKNGWRINGDVE